MSDRLRYIVCILIILISLLLCIAPVQFIQSDNAVKYRSGCSREWQLKKIKTEKNGSVQVNHADMKELTDLYGIGEKLAGMIIAERTENGPYFYPEDLEAVKGIGPATLKQLRSMIDLSQDESGE